MRIYKEIDDHRHSLTPLAEIAENFVRSDVRLCEQNRIPTLPAEEFMKFIQVIKGLVRLFHSIRSLVSYHKGRGIYPKSGHPQSEPKTDDFFNLLPYRWIRGVEVRLIRKESVEVVSFGDLVELPDAGFFA